MPRAEPFPGPQDRRQRLADRFGRVEQQRRAVAEIAVAARFGRLAEVAQQHLTAAAQRLGQTQKRVQPGVVGGLAVGGAAPSSIWVRRRRMSSGP